MEVAGSVVGIVSLGLEVSKLGDLIERLRLNPQRKKDLTELVGKLVGGLESASESSYAADKHVRASLEEVIKTLESLNPEARKMRRLTGFVAEWIFAPGEADKLDEVQRKLENLATQVVVIESIFQLKEELKGKQEELKVVYKGPIHLPECIIGLERAENVLNFLRRSKREELRVVGIHGLPGLGKSTLLHCIWNIASSTAPFVSRALIQIGQSVNDSQICSLQSTILQQLGEERNLQFTVPDGGKEKLRVHLQKLKQDKKPIFLAIDNVFEAEDLRKLFSDTLTKDIPASSVVAITTRNFTVCEEVLRICGLSIDAVSQVHLFNPGLLELDESKRMFAAYGELSPDENAELLESLVPLCGGLPLALTVVGRLFARKARRSRVEWELIKDQMEKLDGGNNATGSITKALQVSYDQFPESYKIAFCKLVQCFYGWCWERVERILGVDVLNGLRETSLISVADHWSKCNQSFFRDGCDGGWDEAIRWTRVVTMHDLVFKFGEGLSTKLPVETVTDPREMGDFKARNLRDLVLQRDNRNFGPVELVTDVGLLTIDQYLERAVNLQSLFLWDASEEYCYRRWGQDGSFCDSLRATYTHDSARRGRLRFLRLENWKASSSIMEMRLSSEIREIHLIGCNDVEQLPDRTSLDALEVLSICKCENFRSFSPSSVGKWRKLKILRVEGCPCLTRVPNELGRLEQLYDLQICDCPLLGTLPTMSCPLRRLHLVKLPIAHLDLKEAASLTEFDGSYCGRLKKLPSAIAKAWSLQTLKLDECKSLEELPAEMGKLAALTELDLSFCKSLKVLPSDICNLSSLRMLSLSAWVSLVELPNEVGKLVALTDLNLSCCTSLKRLPQGIGNARSIESLNLCGCESLEELPDEVGKLVVLTNLDLSCRRSLKRLPPTIGNARSIVSLDLQMCESLVELPDDVGKMVALRKVDLRMCKSLKGLPRGIGDASSLQCLDLSGCESLAELPDEVGKLAALEQLTLCGCQNLIRLPLGIGNVSLRSLDLSGCESLTELPDEVGKLAALEQLKLCGCQNLERLPLGIGNVSLRFLDLSECESLTELPDEVGKLAALIELRLCGCQNLERLPLGIGNVSLRFLDLSECESLTELPDEVGKLAALTELTLCGCQNLVRLPPSIGNVSSLRELDLSRCKNLVELPEEMGNLPALAVLNLEYCENLERLPSAIGNISSLRILNFGCENLRELPGESLSLELKL